MKPFNRLLAAAAALLMSAGFAAAADLSYPIDHVLGRADAPITIVEYASTTCGHCANFHKTTLPRLKTEWIETGKAKLIYRDFPTGPRGLSVGASMIAHCVGDDRYFGLLGLIMDQQEKWMSAKNPLDELKKLAKLAGMGEDKVDECLKRQDLANALDARAKDAQEKLGIESTPSFVVGGKVLVGSQPFEELDKALKAVKK
ncbi:protein-disulfide isomerase [Paramagnetospirillum marisnigri]|uniref:Protein-disulfide isomerase n=1 Tax=Paramagnetospirillum marisnigri TaxID=1285242 RepID=A0A178MHB9_9PROT|nr:DsbA family protein [Paramagnetospirillum marisnigri]OAN48101.1 protein-disulfide isomerase [Paramagnetospirillum marisnigri]